MPKAIAKKLRCDVHSWFDGYVTTLAGGEKRYTTCPKCKDIKLKNEKEKQAMELEEDVKANKLKKLEAIGVPKRFLKSGFDNYIVSGIREKNKKQHYAVTLAKRYIKEFETIKTRGTSLIFCGKPGTGKTHIACAIANNLIDKNYNVLITSVLKCIRKVKQTYSADSKLNEQEIIDGYVAWDLLILDEVGVQFGTNAELMILFEIINDRYANEMPTILISNLDLEEMRKYVGTPIIDRMNERGGAIVSFDWESYRQIKL